MRIFGSSLQVHSFPPRALTSANRLAEVNSSTSQGPSTLVMKSQASCPVGEGHKSPSVSCQGGLWLSVLSLSYCLTRPIVSKVSRAPSMWCRPTGSQRHTEREVHLTTRKRQDWATKEGRALLATPEAGSLPQGFPKPCRHLGLGLLPCRRVNDTVLLLLVAPRQKHRMVAQTVEIRAVAQRESMPPSSRGRRRRGSFGAGRGSTKWGRGARGAGKEEREAGGGDSFEGLRRRPPGREQATQRTGPWGRMGAHGFRGSYLKG